MAVTVPETYGDHRMHFPGRYHQIYTLSLSLLSTIPRDSNNGKKSDVPVHVPDWWKRLSSPEGSKLVGVRKNDIKMVIHTETGTWINILKMTICEVKACNNVNIKRFNMLVNCRVQSFLCPQNLKFLNRFLVFLITPIRFDLPSSGDPYITPIVKCWLPTP